MTKMLPCVVAMAFLLVAPATVAQQPAPTGYDEALATRLGADEYGMKPYVLVILMDGTPDHDAMTALGSEVAGIVHAALRGE